MTTEAPSQILSSLVADKLIESGLLRPEKRAAFIGKMASGKLKGEDWKLEIELASDEEVEA